MPDEPEVTVTAADREAAENIFGCILQSTELRRIFMTKSVEDGSVIIAHAMAPERARAAKMEKALEMIAEFVRDRSGSEVYAVSGEHIILDFVDYALLSDAKKEESPADLAGDGDEGVAP